MTKFRRRILTNAAADLLRRKCKRQKYETGSASNPKLNIKEITEMDSIKGLKDNVPTTEEEWLTCLELPEYLQRIPCGHIVPIAGPEIWTNGNGENMATETWISRYGFDPSVAWAAIKAYRKEAGKSNKITML